MRMTIDGARREMISGKPYTDKFEMALVVAIDIMRKYQKIQEIVKQKDYDRFNSHNYYGYFLRVQDIRKVLEDGKIDRC